MISVSDILCARALSFEKYYLFSIRKLQIMNHSPSTLPVTIPMSNRSHDETPKQVGIKQGDASCTDSLPPTFSLTALDFERLADDFKGLMMANIEKKIVREIDAKVAQQLATMSKSASLLPTAQAGMEAAGTESDKIIEISWIWRACCMTGGLVASGLGFGGFITKSERAAWTAVMFWPFSLACLIVGGACNIRGLGKWQENIAIGGCGFLIGVPLLFAGWTELESEDEGTSIVIKGAGRLSLALGSGYVMIAPFIAYQLASMWNALPNSELNRATVNMMKSVPRVCGSLLYLSTASLRCTWKGNTESVASRCANPIFPSLCVSLLLLAFWVVSYVASPIDRRRCSLTYHDVLSLRMPRTKGALLLSFGMCAIASLILFSATIEEGANITPELLKVLFFWLASFVAVFCLALFEFLLKPLLTRKRSTTRDEGSKSSTIRTSLTVDMGNFSLPGI